MSESITFRCPDDLADTIKSQAQQPGRDKTSVVVGMLRQSLQALPLEDKNNLPAISAIYIVYQQDKLLYVGKTSNLKNRWLSHHRLVQFLQAGSDVYIAWFPCDIEQLDTVEDTFIELLEPEFNGQKVIGQTLATFWVDKQNWKSFKELCRSQGTTASEVLREFVESVANSGSIPDFNKPLDTCLTEDDELLDKRITEKVEERIEEKLKALEVQIEELRGKLKAR